MDDGLKTILLRGPRPFDGITAASCIAPLHPGLPAFDVRRLCRYAGGIIEEHVPAGRAADLVAALASGGVAAIAVDADLVPELPPTRRMVGVVLRDDALVLQDATTAQATRSLRWTEIRATLVHALDQPLGDRDVTSSDEAAVVRAGEATPLSESARRLAYTLARLRRRDRCDALLAIDVIAADARYRIEYTSLVWRESPCTHSLDTFIGLARRIDAATVHLVSPPENGALIEGLVDAARFAHEEELKRYERWLLSPAVVTSCLDTCEAASDGASTVTPT